MLRLTIDCDVIFCMLMINVGNWGCSGDDDIRLVLLHDKLNLLWFGDVTNMIGNTVVAGAVGGSANANDLSTCRVLLQHFDNMSSQESARTNDKADAKLGDGKLWFRHCAVRVLCPKSVFFVCVCWCVCWCGWNLEDPKVDIKFGVKRAPPR